MPVTPIRPQATVPAATPETCPDKLGTFIADISVQAFDTNELLKVVQTKVFEEVVERANEAGCREFQDAADAISSLIAIASRQVEAIAVAADDGYSQFVVGQNKSPRRHVQIHRKKAFDDAYAVLVGANQKMDAMRARGITENFPAALITEHAAAVKGLLGTRATDIEQVTRKIRAITAEFGDLELDGMACLAPVVADLDRLAKAER